MAAGHGDGELLQWITRHAPHKRTEPEVASWSAFAEQRVPSDAESRAYFNDQVSKGAPNREDIGTWFEWLDVDDYASFGGRV